MINKLVMKNSLRILIVFMIAGSSMVSMAQTNVITLAPLGIVNKFRVKYECKLTDNITVGAFANCYYGVYKGFRADPFIRIYTSGKAPQGFYLQAKACIGSFSKNVQYSNSTDTTSIKRTWLTYGGGMACGYQCLLGKSKIPLDIMFGFAYSPFTAPRSIIVNESKLNTSDQILWGFTGPGSFLNASFEIGFAF